MARTNILIVTGDIGTGKTMVAAALAYAWASRAPEGSWLVIDGVDRHGKARCFSSPCHDPTKTPYDAMLRRKPDFLMEPWQVTDILTWSPLSCYAQVIIVQHHNPGCYTLPADPDFMLHMSRRPSDQV